MRLNKVLVICSIILVFFIAFAASASGTVKLFNDNGDGVVYVMKPLDTIGVRINVSNTLSGVDVNVKRIYGSESADMRLSVYQWNSSYMETVKADPVLSRDFPNIKRNTTYTLEGELTSGEYLIVITSLKGSWGINRYESGLKNARFYENGIDIDGSYEVYIHTTGDLKQISKEINFADKLDVRPDTWHAVDGLGRTLSTYDIVGGVKKNKFVGIFYWTSSGYWGDVCKPYNITRLLQSVPEEVALAARNDYDHDLWKTDGNPAWFWDEPLFGYYKTTDSYVLRKHAEMLADAGVDVIMFDCAVGINTTASYMNVFDVFAKARKQGVKTPDIAFILPMGDAESCAKYLRLLYDQIYKKGLYKDLWFYWDDKPLILAYVDKLETTGTDAEIRSFFTFRRADAYSWRTEDFISTPERPFWGWLNTYPQTKYFNDGVGKKVEQITVGVAQNVDVVRHVPTAMNGNNVAGRSYTYGNYSYTYVHNGKKVVVNSQTENAVLYGLNFQQQWDYAIKANPEFIFVTGWNEWTVGRYKEFEGIKNAFPDQYDTEYSRDIEPSAGILKDHYYYQLVENIRRFKGVSKPQKISAEKSIDIFGDLGQWDSITSYDHYIGSTWNRANNGYVSTYYENYTMRNDIVRSKVAYDNENIYFYVETLQNLSPNTDTAWMRLFLDTDPTGKSGNWEGFEYVINRVNPDDEYCIVEKSSGVDKSGMWVWETVGKVRYAVKGDVLQIEVPRKIIKMTGREISFNFKWSDNMQQDGNIMDFYVNGDVAPGGRFMFHFEAHEGLFHNVDSTSSSIMLYLEFNS